jgi:hypothetical protein
VVRPVAFDRAEFGSGRSRHPGVVRGDARIVRVCSWRPVGVVGAVEGSRHERPSERLVRNLIRTRSEASRTNRIGMDVCVSEAEIDGAICAFGQVVGVVTATMRNPPRMVLPWLPVATTV